MTDSFDLERFVRAQDAFGAYAQALAELRAGRKTGHWMWFVFPQVAGLGQSAMAQRYAVSGLPEARAYLAHPVLGRRLLECAEVLDGLDESDPQQVLGHIDAVKLRSSMTLFERAVTVQRGTHDTLDTSDTQDTEDHSGAADLFGRVLDHYFGGRRDDYTLAIVGGVS
jgi:uncharacterized protein (DUF1810 family)